MAFTFTFLDVNCVFGFEQKYWRIDGFGENKARIGGIAYPYSPPSCENSFILKHECEAKDRNYCCSNLGAICAKCLYRFVCCNMCRMCTHWACPSVRCPDHVPWCMPTYILPRKKTIDIRGHNKPKKSATAKFIFQNMQFVTALPTSRLPLA